MNKIQILSSQWWIAAISAAAISAGGIAAFAQSAQPPVAFEVTSVKLVEPPIEYSRYGQQNGRLDYKAASLTDCLSRAYGINSRQIVGPDWLNQNRFDIIATAPAGTADNQLMSMLKTLLADRFGMVAHRETRDLTEYALIVAKNGPKLKQSDASGNTNISILPQRGIRNGWSLKNATMTQFVDFLTSFGAQRDNALDRPIVDKTGLNGKFDFDFVWSPQTGPAATSAATDDTAGPSVFTAVQDQLGLKLDARKGPVEVLVVDHAEKLPTQN
jgi:uncharacterized protein (TIGR03435 family)